MSIGATMKVEGVTAALRTLRDLDAEFQKQVKKDIRAAAKPLQQKAREYVPLEPPLSGFSRSWTRSTGGTVAGWNARGKTRNKVVIKTGGKRRRDGTYLLVAVVQTDAMGAIYDMAGRNESLGNVPSGEAMILKLNKIRDASRGMWPAAEQELPHVQQVVRGILDTVSARLTKELA
jgi:hypothetical protein